VGKLLGCLHGSVHRCILSYLYITVMFSIVEKVANGAIVDVKCNHVSFPW